MSATNCVTLNIMIPANNGHAEQEPLETIAARAVRAAARAAQAPVPIRPEPARRDLALEEEIDHEHIAHHQRRRDEEIAAVRNKFARDRQQACTIFTIKTDNLQKQYKKRVLKFANGDCGDRDYWELLQTLSIDHGKQLQHEAGVYQIKLQHLSSARENAKIAAITTRRHELSWTCPNDGQAHPFTFQGLQYHRTYDGEMWLAHNWKWCGEWAGYYIASANPPHDLNGW